MSRQTLARGVIGTVQAVQPIVNLMRGALLESKLICIDERRVQVIKKPGGIQPIRATCRCSTRTARESAQSLVLQFKPISSSVNLDRFITAPLLRE